MLQSQSLVNLCTITQGFCRMCSWKTNFLLKGYCNSHLGKVSAVVCSPTSNGWKFISHSNRTGTANSWRWESSQGLSPAPAQAPQGTELPELLLMSEGGWGLPPTSMFWWVLGALVTAAAASQVRQVFVPEDQVNTGPEPKPV